MEYVRRYGMESIHNLRDLGGYAARGGVTRFGVFFRSDLPWFLTDEDKNRIRALGVAIDLDLRDVEESVPMRDELQDVPGIEYIQIPMKNVRKAAVRDRPDGRSAFDPEFFWGDEYIRMLESNHAWAKYCVELLAGADRPVLFHCFTGKDRTGILAALALGGCGVSDKDIAADYSLSQIYLTDVYSWMRENIDDFREAGEKSPFFSTDAANILALLTHIRREYGGIVPFLRECGVGGDTLEALCQRLIKKA
ncbi:MAG: tyrosine-protein phosphatase [Oscillospiraceae bacterium]|nr:tyrosine-protein phosphatase [Oscillospiraceae bacterium]